MLLIIIKWLTFKDIYKILKIYIILRLYCSTAYHLLILKSNYIHKNNYSVIKGNIFLTIHEINFKVLKISHPTVVVINYPMNTQLCMRGHYLVISCFHQHSYLVLLSIFSWFIFCFKIFISAHADSLLPSLSFIIIACRHYLAKFLFWSIIKPLGNVKNNKIITYLMYNND